MSFSDFFPLGAFGCRQPYQADSCGLNTIHFWWHSQSNANQILDQAESLGIHVILGRVREKDHPSLTDISSGRRLVQEIKSNTSHTTGREVEDADALNHDAYMVFASEPVYFQEEFHDEQPGEFYRESQNYYVFFRLKIRPSSKSHTVCSLFVNLNDIRYSVRIAARVLRDTDFTQTGEYETFLLTFTYPKEKRGNVNYGILYMGNRDSLFCDYVEIMDEMAYQLRSGNFKKYINTLTKFYNRKRSLYRYYLCDEPSPEQYWASGVVNAYLKTLDSHKSGIQVLSHSQQIKEYVKIVNPNELVIDNYPLYGRTHFYGPTPKDSGFIFQHRIDNMCNFITEIRTVSLYTHKCFYFLPQSFGHLITDSNYTWSQSWNMETPYNYEGWFREPTPRELRCMVWLALAHGAKGLIYYRYQSHPESYNLPAAYNNYKDYHWIAGLTDPTGQHKRPLWFTVRDINSELSTITNILMELQSDKVFKTSNIPSEDCYIVNASDTLLHIGTFHDIRNNYFIIVNRHCLPEDNIICNITLRYPRKIYLHDCVTRQELMHQPISNKNTYSFNIHLSPGQGKLYKILSY